MTRQEIYNAIKAEGLEEEVKKSCGKNYTQCSNVDLETVLSNHYATKNWKPAKDKKKAPTSNVDDLKRSIELLLELFIKRKLLLASEVKSLLQSLQAV